MVIEVQNEDTSSPVQRALSIARARLTHEAGRSGEPFIAHAEGTIAILTEIMADEACQVAAALFAEPDRFPSAEIEREFGTDVALIVESMRQVLRLRGLHRRTSEATAGEQLETLRRMLLAMASDIRVVLLRLASRLQTLRWHARERSAPEPGVSQETLDVLAPLANRLGLWQLKWELEDLAFRFLWPDTYRALARQLEEKRHEREAFVERAVERVRESLASAGVAAEVSGRPKHIYSIWNKMRVKQLDLDEIQDLRGLRVIVEDVRACYAALAVVHELWAVHADEFDDYIARPKPNGYQSLHTVVIAEDGRPLEVQIRTREMHDFAEYGVASHWRYKERSTGLAGQRGDAAQEQRVAWMRQLLAWQREIGAQLGGAAQPVSGGRSEDDDVDPAGAETAQVPVPTGDTHIYVLTPQARVIELPVGSTAVDFAYHVHTNLGHRCRGARVDGQMVPLNTVLATGQTVDVVVAKSGSGSDGPSRDWLNPQLGYVRSNRARSKVRQWFHALDQQRDIAAGRERVEKVLQREGRTSLSFDELSARLHQPDSSAMFVAVAREEIGPRQLEDAVRGAERTADPVDGDEGALQAVLDRARGRRQTGGDDGVLVVGVDLLMTQLARCCRPVPPDEIAGFVTRGRGVSVHRADCPTFGRMARHAPERVLDTSWGDRAAARKAAGRSYPAEVEVRATDRPGLLHDVTEVFARDRLNVTAVRTLSKKQTAHMQFTVEVPDVQVLTGALSSLLNVPGVFEARRR
jgi:GTP pyrophosphokinase